MSLFFLNALYIMWRGHRDSQDFLHYLAEQYPAEFNRMAYHDVAKKILLFLWHKDSLVYFMFTSPEDFGDPRIAIYRNKVKWGFRSFIINAIAAAVFFLMVALWLEYIIGR